MKKIILLTILLLSGLIIKAQEVKKNSNVKELVTDRPDQTEASTLVSKGFLQVETGFFYEEVTNGKIKTKMTTYNTTLLRYGLLDNLELRIGFDNTTVKANSKTKSNGFSPLVLGAKIGIAKEKGLLPKIALIGHLDLPFIASKDYKTTNTSVDFRFAFAHTLNKFSNLSYNLGMVWNGNNSEPNYIYTISYGYSLSKKLGSFIELYGEIPEKGKSAHLWDIGFTYLLKDNIQFDISGGTGFSNNQDLYLSAGVTFRLPN